jgi:hypothetical protein
MPHIHGEIGDGLSLFYQHYRKRTEQLCRPIGITFSPIDINIDGKVLTFLAA